MKTKTFIIFFLLLLLLPLKDIEASGIKLGIYPPLIEIEAIPPAKTEATLSIMNYEEKEINLKIIYKLFKPSALENGEIEFLNSEEFLKDDPLLFQRIKILDENEEITSITLGPKQKKDLTITTNIPKDETLSDYYFSIIFVSTNNPNNQSTQAVSVGGIATNVLLSIGEKGMAKGNIEEYSTPTFIENGPVPFTIRVKNKGNHFITPKGEILIKNLFGQTVGRVDLLAVNILSQSIRMIPDSLQSIEATKPAYFKYQENSKPYAYWNENFLLGPYTATLTIALSENGPLFKKTIYFFALPLKILLGIIIAIFITVYLYKRIKKYKRK